MEKQECGVPIGYQIGLETVKIIRRRYGIKVSMILPIIAQTSGNSVVAQPNHARYF
ncbi:Uncharacterised protein [Bartonella grahamii]|uniref:Uncharacterized protein n=1 Tax=Bartonella grahamii TaxID=33045 RepID=A0A336NA11_BARGR|nr:Uncharacterised protein [Bartonella grahamii]